MKIKNIAIPIVISVFCLTAAPVFTIRRQSGLLRAEFLSGQLPVRHRQ